jgi:hypothetical protein
MCVDLLDLWVQGFKVEFELTTYTCKVTIVAVAKAMAETSDRQQVNPS